jgi:hypothetical protein
LHAAGVTFCQCLNCELHLFLLLFFADSWCHARSSTL